jgi:hypothetical protein
LTTNSSQLRAKRGRALLSGVCGLVVLLALAGFAPRNLITGDGGRTGVQPDLSMLNLARVVYGSEGGPGEAYYSAAGRVWARWETDFPRGDENLAFRLNQLTRIKTNPKVASRFLTAPDLADFPLLYLSDPGWMLLSQEEKAALRRYLASGGFLWIDDFWGQAEWRQLEQAMQEVLPGRDWQVLSQDHPIFHQVFELKEMPQVPAFEWAMPDRPTMEPQEGHKYPMGQAREPQMRAWFDDDGRIMALATHNTDIGDGWEREAYGDWYFETFSTKSYMVAINVVAYAMTH